MNAPVVPPGRIRRERRRVHGDRRLKDADAFVAWSLAAATAASVLAIGAVHLPVLLAVALVVLAATLQAARLHTRRSVTSSALWPALIAAALALYTVLQAVPLPMGVLEKLAPANADVWARALHPLGEGAPRFASVSLDPGASVVEALKWAVYAGVLFSSAVVGAHRGADFGVAVVFASAALAALTTLGHGLLGASKVFGLYQPQFAAASWHIGPLLNPNNLSGYLNLGAFCGVGLFLMRRPLLPRWLVGLGVTTILAIGVTAASRAGLGVLPLGAAMFAVLLLRRVDRHEARERSPNALTALLAMALGGGLSLALLGSSSMTWLELSDKNVSKLELFRSVLPMIRDHLWLGVGRGAFESVFPAYRVTPGNVVFTHAEDFPLQWASEWGLPVALAAIAGFAWTLRPGQLGVRRSTVVIGAWTGMLVLLAQNLADLALEVPAVSIGCALVLGSLSGDGRRRGAARSQPMDEPSAFGVSARLALVGVLGAGLLASAAVWGYRDLDRDRSAIRAAQEASEAERSARPALREALRAAMLRHPGEPYLPLIGAVSAWQSHEENPLPWLQRALERSQRNGRAHFLLADVLAARGVRGQSLLELKLAILDDPELIAPAVRRMMRWTKSFDELATALPDGPLGARVLEVLSQQLLQRGDELLRLRCAREALARDPAAIGARFAAADVLLAAIGQDLPPGLCTGPLRTACAQEVKAHAAAIEAADHASPHPVTLRARLLLHEGQAVEAEELLADACVQVNDALSCLRLRVQAASASKSGVRLSAAAKEMLNVACSAPSPCAEAATWLGDRMAGRQEWGAAVTYYERALSEEPRPDRWKKLGEAASRAGGHARAIEAFQRALDASGGLDPALKQRIDEERGKAVSRLIAR